MKESRKKGKMGKKKLRKNKPERNSYDRKSMLGDKLN